MAALLGIPPDRDVVKSLSRILLDSPFLGMNALSTPVAVARALRHHAPADPALALAAFAAAVNLDVFGMPYGEIFPGVLENYPKVSDPDIRDRARIELQAAADSSTHPAATEAQTTLVALLATPKPPEPGPIVLPPTTVPVPPTPAPSLTRPSSLGLVLLGVGLMAVMGVAVWTLAMPQRRFA